MRLYIFALAGVTVAGCAQQAPQAVPVAPASKPVPAPAPKIVTVSETNSPVVTPTYPPVQIGPPPGSTPEPYREERLAAIRQHKIVSIARRDARIAGHRAVAPESSPTEATASRDLDEQINDQIAKISRASTAGECRDLAFVCLGTSINLRKMATSSEVKSQGTHKMMAYNSMAEAWQELTSAARLRARIKDGRSLGSEIEVGLYYTRARRHARDAMRMR